MANTLEIEERVTEVLRMLVSGFGRDEILEKARIEWKIERAQTDNYIRKAKDIFQALAKEAKQDKDAMIGLAQRRLDNLYKNNLRTLNYQGALNTQKEINKLFGLYEPEKHQMEGEITLKQKLYKTVSPDDWDDEKDKK
jgi:F0F1-type ATP synthase delta subunit